MNDFPPTNPIIPSPLWNLRPTIKILPIKVLAEHATILVKKRYTTTHKTENQEALSPAERRKWTRRKQSPKRFGLSGKHNVLNYLVLC